MTPTASAHEVFIRQLSKLPTSEKRFSRACVDHPSDADLCEMKLRHGDIVIAYVRGGRSLPCVEANVSCLDRRTFGQCLPRRNGHHLLHGRATVSNDEANAHVDR